MSKMSFQLAGSLRPNHNVFKYQMLSKSEQWLLRKLILSFGTLSFIIVLVVVLVADRNTVVALASAGISVELASWGLARLTDSCFVNRQIWTCPNLIISSVNKKSGLFHIYIMDLDISILLYLNI